MRKLIFIGFLLLASLSIQAQKYGHINLGNLISEMPAAIAADDELQALQTTLVEDGTAQAAVVQKEIDAFITAAQSGTLTRQQQEQQQAVLEGKQAKIAQLEQEMGVTINKKREELLQPIITSAQQAIADVAKENNIQLVFDTSIFGAIMFAAESEDIMPLVKAKLGM